MTDDFNAQTVLNALSRASFPFVAIVGHDAM